MFNEFARLITLIRNQYSEILEKIYLDPEILTKNTNLFAIGEITHAVNQTVSVEMHLRKCCVVSLEGFVLFSKKSLSSVAIPFSERS